MKSYKNPHLYYTCWEDIENIRKVLTGQGDVLYSSWKIRSGKTQQQQQLSGGVLRHKCSEWRWCAILITTPLSVSITLCRTAPWAERPSSTFWNIIFLVLYKRWLSPRKRAAYARYTHDVELCVRRHCMSQFVASAPAVITYSSNKFAPDPLPTHCSCHWWQEATLHRGMRSCAVLFVFVASAEPNGTARQKSLWPSSFRLLGTKRVVTLRNVPQESI